MGVLTIVIGVILAICGFSFIFTPGIAFLSISLLLGIALLVGGINKIVLFACKKQGAGGQVLAGGIIFALLGILMICSNWVEFITDMIIIYAFASGIVIDGAIAIISSVKQKEKKNATWGWKLAFGILTLILGVYCFFHPMVSAMTIGCLIGFIVIMQGFNLIGVGSEMKK